MKSEGLVEPESYWCVPAAPLLTPTPPPHFTPCKCVSVNVRVQLPSDVLKMHQSQTGSPDLEGIHPRYVVYLVVVCCAGCNPFALIADVRDRSKRRNWGPSKCHVSENTSHRMAGTTGIYFVKQWPLLPSPFTPF